jgi:AraC-like DNA-binding protein
MKPILVRKTNSLNASIDFDDREYSQFYNPWHFHPELELTLVIKSFGQRQVGDSVENFWPGDLVLVGSNLPHVWKNDVIFNDENLKAKAIVVKFLPDFAGKDFFERPEMKRIQTLIKKYSNYGVKLVGSLRSEIEKIMLTLPNAEESSRIIYLLTILDLISKSDEYVLLSNITYHNEKAKSNYRINIVLNYLMDHYSEDIQLETIASLVNMNKNAFCRFFKKSTRKNLFQVIQEIRINNACQKLIETDLSVLEVCFDTGFGNISGFNKTFKKIKGINPLGYKKKYKNYNNNSDLLI